MIYLASPYSVGPKGAYGEADTGTASKNLKTRRYKQACKKAAELMLDGEVVFSPIAHSHSVEIEGMNGQIKSGDFWLDQDLAILSKCDTLVVYKMRDWERSRGIAREIAFAEANNIPVVYLGA
jgi:hypothetical protein